MVDILFVRGMFSFRILVNIYFELGFLFNYFIIYLDFIMNYIRFFNISCGFWRIKIVFKV